MAGQSFARQFLVKAVTVPLGTTIAAPQSTTWAFGRALLHRIEIMVPRGHNGRTGIAVTYGGLGILPFSNPTSFLVANGETVGVDFDDQEIGDAGLTVVAFNNDIWNHTFYLRANINQDLGAGAGSGSVPLLALG